MLTQSSGSQATIGRQPVPGASPTPKAASENLTIRKPSDAKSATEQPSISNSNKTASAPRVFIPQKLTPEFKNDIWRPVRAFKLVEIDGRYYTGGKKFSAKGEYNFVTINGNTYVARKGKGGHFNISQGAESVDYAGTVRFGRSNGTRGYIQNWTNNSGHYKPSEAQNWQSGFPVYKFNNIK